MAGWTFEQNEAFPDKTNVNYVVQVNANGSIPKAIVNFTSSDCSSAYPSPPPPKIC